jgi:two-component system response regulator MprA
LDVKTIMVVDDDLDILDVMAITLEGAGYHVLCCSGGEAGLEQARSEIPDLILLDLMMPGMTGQEFVEAQREDPQLADIPVILLSAHASAPTIASTYGVAGFLRKPVELRDLLQEVGQHVA